MESDIHKWIVERLSVSLSNFNNMPACPFAKQALLDNKIKVINIKDKTDFINHMKAAINDWPTDVEVVVLGTDPSTITPIELTKITEDANNTYLNENGFLALEDHPNEPEYAAGYHVNEGNWALILLQSKNKIITARKILEKRGYYKNWDSEYYNQVVLERS